MPGEYGLGRLVVRAVVVGVARQTRVEVGIAGGEQRAPPRLEVPQIEDILQPVAAGRLVVHQRGVWREHDQLPGAMRAQAEVEVVVDDLVRFLEATERFVDAAPHQHAGAGHRNDIALCQGQAEVTRFVGRGEAERVARDATCRQEHTGVLHLAVGIQQLRPDHRHLRPLRMFQQRVQPIRLDHLDVVVQEQQILAGCRLDPAVVELRPVERLRHRHDPVGVLLQPDLPRDLTGGNVVDADDLEVAIRRAIPQRLDAGLDVAARGAGRDDDRHHPGRGRRSPQPPCAGRGAGQHLGRDAAPCRCARQGRGLDFRVIDLL